MSKELKKRLDRIKEEKPLKIVVAPKGVNPQTYKRENFPDEPNVVVIEWEASKL